MKLCVLDVSFLSTCSAWPAAVNNCHSLCAVAAITKLVSYLNMTDRRSKEIGEEIDIRDRIQEKGNLCVTGGLGGLRTKGLGTGLDNNQPNQKH